VISKNRIKLIKGLENKKTRREDNSFVAEGPKSVGDLLMTMKPKIIIATAEWLKSNHPSAGEIIEVSEEELRKVSFLMHPQEVMGVFEIPHYKPDTSIIGNRICLALDGVQDPGNVGTIIRIADWFGITDIFCSHDTADVWNPKTVQATMGSIARVKIYYTDLKQMIDSLPVGIPVYGTMLDGENIYQSDLSQNGLIIMGNEGNGISAEIAAMVNKKLLIPSFPPGRITADSLNVAIATAITCAEFRKNM
jgi:TrmH family RNA methyltransferase